jgi:hypothetical protein
VFVCDCSLSPLDADPDDKDAHTQHQRDKDTSSYDKDVVVLLRTLAMDRADEINLRLGILAHASEIFVSP